MSNVVGDDFDLDGSDGNGFYACGWGPWRALPLIPGVPGAEPFFTGSGEVTPPPIW